MQLKLGCGISAVGQPRCATPRGASVLQRTRQQSRHRYIDGLNSQAVSEVKNVGRQSLTLQLRDDIDHARANGLRFDLYVRGSTQLSGPLVRADLDPLNPLNIRYIP